MECLGYFEEYYEWLGRVQCLGTGFHEGQAARGVSQLLVAARGVPFNCPSPGYSIGVTTPKGKRIMTEWKAFVRRTILSIPRRVLQNIHDSVPRRMAMLIEARGGPIRC